MDFGIWIGRSSTLRALPPLLIERRQVGPMAGVDAGPVQMSVTETSMFTMFSVHCGLWEARGNVVGAAAGSWPLWAGRGRATGFNLARVGGGGPRTGDRRRWLVLIAAGDGRPPRSRLARPWCRLTGDAPRALVDRLATSAPRSSRSSLDGRRARPCTGDGIALRVFSARRRR